MIERILREGLRANDLESLVLNTFEIDTFQSKMGEDRDVCVLSFKVKDREPAKDMMEFIEKGYNFVMDADISSGEDRNGMYQIFVEIPRDNSLPKYIKEITDGVKRLTGINEWKFRFYKKVNSVPFNEETLAATIPLTPDAYDQMLENIKVESIQRFFSKTYKDNIVVEGNKITIQKPFGVKISFNMVEFSNKEDIEKSITETVKVDTKSMSEVLWLTKLLGDMNITKYGNNFVLEHGKKAMVIQMEI